MTSLHQVCVPTCLSWNGSGCMPINHEDWQEHIDITGSPNVYFTTECATGLNEFIKEGFKFYPNPTNDQLTIETRQPGKHFIEISSLIGQLLYTDRIEGPTHKIDLSSFEKGYTSLR